MIPQNISGPVLFFFVASLAWADPTIHSPETRKIKLDEIYQPRAEKGVADLFIPLPLRNSGYQEVVSETYDSNAQWTKEENIPVGKDGDGVRILHAHWQKTDKPSLTLHEVLAISDREGGLAAKDVDPIFLQPSVHVQTDGLVKETAQKITAGVTDPDQKARAIYNWIIENTYRDPKTRGCGLGDVKTTLQPGHLGGKCADLNSVFVGLARASGLPAREVWGLRLAPSNRSKSLGKDGDVSKSQHCRAEYYSATTKAWVPADPADVRKVMLEENLPLHDSHVEKLRTQLFGAWEGNWMALNSGRDLQLSNGKKLNFLMYPQLFTSSSNPDGVDPAEVGYQFSAKVLP